MGRLAPSSEAGLETEGYRARALPRTEGRGPRCEREEWTRAALAGDRLEERDEDAKTNANPSSVALPPGWQAASQRCSALSVNELLSTFFRLLGREGSLHRLPGRSFRQPSPTPPRTRVREGRRGGRVSCCCVFRPHHSSICTRSREAAGVGTLGECGRGAWRN